MGLRELLNDGEIVLDAVEVVGEVVDVDGEIEKVLEREQWTMVEVVEEGVRPRRLEGPGLMAQVQVQVPP